MEKQQTNGLSFGFLLMPFKIEKRALAQLASIFFIYFLFFSFFFSFFLLSCTARSRFAPYFFVISCIFPFSFGAAERGVSRFALDVRGLGLNGHEGFGREGHPFFYAGVLCEKVFRTNGNR